MRVRGPKPRIIALLEKEPMGSGIRVRGPYKCVSTGQNEDEVARWTEKTMRGVKISCQAAVSGASAGVVATAEDANGNGVWEAVRKEAGEDNDA
jgi:hypothetical protein